MVKIKQKKQIIEIMLLKNSMGENKGVILQKVIDYGISYKDIKGSELGDYLEDTIKDLGEKVIKWRGKYGQIFWGKNRSEEDFYKILIERDFNVKIRILEANTWLESEGILYKLGKLGFNR